MGIMAVKVPAAIDELKKELSDTYLKLSFFIDCISNVVAKPNGGGMGHHRFDGGYHVRYVHELIEKIDKKISKLLAPITGYVNILCPNDKACLANYAVVAGFFKDLKNNLAEHEAIMQAAWISLRNNEKFAEDKWLYSICMFSAYCVKARNRTDGVSAALESLKKRFAVPAKRKIA
jgi:hypothetical protein